MFLMVYCSNLFCKTHLFGSIRETIPCSACERKLVETLRTSKYCFVSRFCCWLIMRNCKSCEINMGFFEDEFSWIIIWQNVWWAGYQPDCVTSLRYHLSDQSRWRTLLKCPRVACNVSHASTWSISPSNKYDWYFDGNWPNTCQSFCDDIFLYGR